MIIREMKADELPAICGLLEEIDQDANMPPSQAQSIWEAMNGYSYYKVFVAEDKAADPPAIVGTFALLIGHNLGHGGKPFAIVENVVVHPDHRGKGVGRRMMEEAMILAKAQGCYKLMLSSDIKREAAHRFYDSLGFERHGISFRMNLISRA